MSNYQRYVEIYPVHLLFSAVTCMLLTCLVGCGEKLPPDLPKLYPTKLVVIQDDKPLEGANVNLLPKDSNSRWAASGVTNSSGGVEFFTEGRYRGVPEGDYQVTVSKVYTEPSQYLGKERPKDIDYPTWNRLMSEEKRNTYYKVIKLIFVKLSRSSKMGDSFFGESRLF